MTMHNVRVASGKGSELVVALCGDHRMMTTPSGTSGSIAAEAPLMDAGVDSIVAMELATRLRSVKGVAALSPTLVFEQPTPRATAAHLVE